VVAELAAAVGLDLTAGSPTKGMAAINVVLDAAPVPVREKLLIAVLDLLQRRGAGVPRSRRRAHQVAPGERSR
jgi:hypothetical protein